MPLKVFKLVAVGAEKFGIMFPCGVWLNQSFLSTPILQQIKYFAIEYSNDYDFIGPNKLYMPYTNQYNQTKYGHFLTN